MTEGQKYPSTIEGWIDLLLPKKIPSAVNIAKPCLQAMQEQDLSYLQISDRLINDPVISLLIMREANLDPARSNVFSKTLDNAMSMIGMERLKTILSTTPLLPEDYGYRAFYRALDQSLTKAFLAKEFASKKLPAKKEDVFWGSLFSDAALWYLWCFATPLMRKLEATEASKKQLAAEKIFGVGFRELQVAILEALGTPELAIMANSTNVCLSAEDWVELSKFADSVEVHGASLAHGDELEDLSKKLKIARQSPLFLIELASLYMHYVLEARTAKQTSRAIRIASAGLGMTGDDFHKLTTKALLSYSRKIRFPFCSSPASLLFMDYDVPAEQHEPPVQKASDLASGTTPSASSTPSTAAADTTIVIESKDYERKSGDIEIAASDQKTVSGTLLDDYKPSNDFLRLLKRIKTQPSSFKSSHNLMSECIIQLVDGLDLRRGIIALINQDRSKLKVYYKHGIESDDQLSGFQTQMVSSTVFKILSEKSAALWVKPSDKKSVTDLVPLNFKQATQSDEGLFMSIFVKQRPVAIVYADKHPEAGIIEPQFRYFKLMNKALENALNVLGSTKK